MARIALWLALAAALAAPAWAQDSSIEEAKAHAASAKTHYDLGEYQQAAEEYIKVYRIRQLPALLFNIAQSYRKAGQYAKAKQFYESYLRETQDPKNRAAIEKAIKEIDELLAKEKKAKDGPPQGIAQERGLSAPATGAAAPPKTGGVAPPPLAVAPPPAVVPPLPQPSAAAAKQPATTPAAQPPATTQPSTTLAAATPAKATVPASTAAAAPASTRSAAGGTSRPSTGLDSPAPPAPRAEKSHTLFWVAAGASAAALAAGGVFGAKTLSSRSTDDASKANLLYGIGGGLAAVTGAIFLLTF